jgi:hypothetical protein
MVIFWLEASFLKIVNHRNWKMIPNNGHFFHQSMTLGLRHLSRAASSVVRGFPLGSMRLFTDVLLV